LLQDLGKVVAISEFRMAGSILDASMPWVKNLTTFGALSAEELGIRLVSPTVYDRLQIEVDDHRDELTTLEPEQVEAEFEQTLTLQISRTATRIIQARFTCNRRMQTMGQDPIFKPTVVTEYVAAMLPQWVAADEQQFRQFIDWMFKFVYESSGDLKRLIPFGDLHPITMAIKFLRHFYFHDLEHGEAKETERKYKRVGDVFTELVGSAIIEAPVQWQRTQLAVLRGVEDLLQKLNESLRDRRS